jgi:hypothetical protein
VKVFDEVRVRVLEPVVASFEALLDVLADARAKEDGALPWRDLDDELVPRREVEEAPNRSWNHDLTARADTRHVRLHAR